MDENDEAPEPLEDDDNGGVPPEGDKREIPPKGEPAVPIEETS